MDYATAYARTVNPQKVQKADFVGPRVWEPLRGSRLGYHLAEIARVYGANDEGLAELAQKALRGSVAGSAARHDHFSQIRDRLMDHAAGEYGVPHGLSPSAERQYRQRAAELASAYNWHRASDSVQLDELVGNHVRSIVKDAHRERLAGRELREAARRFSTGGEVEGSRFRHDPDAHKAAMADPASDVARFWKGLRAAVKSRMTSTLGANPGNVTDKMIDRSLRRLAKNEESLADVEATKSDYHKPRPQSGGGAAYHWRDYLKWTPAGPNLEGVESYARDFDAVVRYGLGDRLAGVVGAADAVVSKAVDATAGRVARAVGVRPDQVPKTPGRGRVMIDPRTGDEPGVDLWTGNESRKKPPLKAEIVPEPQPGDGVVYDGRVPKNSKLVAATAAAAHVERSAVRRALESRAADPNAVTDGDVHAHVVELRRLASSPEGRELLGPKLKHYEERAAELPAKLGKAKSILSTSPDSRATGPDVDVLSALVGPLVRVANANLVARGYPKPLSGAHAPPSGFEVVHDEPPIAVDPDADFDDGAFDLPSAEGLHSPAVDEIESHRTPTAADNLLLALRRLMGKTAIDEPLPLAPKAKKSKEPPAAEGVDVAPGIDPNAELSPLPLADDAEPLPTAKSKVPLAKVRQAIADYRVSGLSPADAVARLADEYGLDRKTAERQWENFKSLKKKPDGRRETPPEPRKQRPLKRRKYEADGDPVQYEAWKSPPGGYVDGDGLYYEGGSFVPPPTKFAADERPKPKRSKKRSLIRAVKLIRALSTTADSAA